jgi:hypothetical protein
MSLSTGSEFHLHILKENIPPWVIHTLLLFFFPSTNLLLSLMLSFYGKDDVSLTIYFTPAQMQMGITACQ